MFYRVQLCLPCFTAIGTPLLPTSLDTELPTFFDSLRTLPALPALPGTALVSALLVIVKAVSETRDR